MNLHVFFAIFVVNCVSTKDLGPTFPPFSVRSYFQTLKISDDLNCSELPDLPLNAHVLLYTPRVTTVYCDEGHYIEGDNQFYCENGEWSYNKAPKCVKGCPAPPSVRNGTVKFIHNPPINTEPELYKSGSRVRYSCSPGYTREPYSSEYLFCQDGIWTGPEAMCKQSKTECPLAKIENGYYEHSPYDISGKRVIFHCNPGYKLRGPDVKFCHNGGEGVWYPKTETVCEKMFFECPLPLTVPFAHISDVSYDNNYDGSSRTKFPIRSKVTYQCNQGYVIEGNNVLTCSGTGYWEPSVPPVCYQAGENAFFPEFDNLNAGLITAATGAGVLGILLLICLVVACKRRKRSGRAANLPPPMPGQVLNDHAVLLQHPDRLALIAFAEGVQEAQNSLPTYDEAVRNERSVFGNGGLTVNRLHRPHWPNLAAAGRRTRNSPNPDTMVHVARHGSFASHTPSTRSGGDSMGSTDTVAASEGSTIVTLDTASSHSGSQNASCRVHCGSLGSFDGCSVVNTDDVPLLEESEFEEIQGGNNEADNQVISDNVSSKISTNSAPVMS